MQFSQKLDNFWKFWDGGKQLFMDEKLIISLSPTKKSRFFRYRLLGKGGVLFGSGWGFPRGGGLLGGGDYSGGGGIIRGV